MSHRTVNNSEAKYLFSLNECVDENSVNFYFSKIYQNVRDLLRRQFILSITMTDVKHCVGSWHILGAFYLPSGNNRVEKSFRSCKQGNLYASVRRSNFKQMLSESHMCGICTHLPNSFNISETEFIRIIPSLKTSKPEPLSALIPHKMQISPKTART